MGVINRGQPALAIPFRLLTVSGYIQKVPKAAYVKAIRDARWLSRPMNGVLSGEAAVDLNFLRARFIAHTVGWARTLDFYHTHS
jgi:hypothetical protein